MTYIVLRNILEDFFKIESIVDDFKSARCILESSEQIQGSKCTVVGIMNKEEEQ